MGTPITSTERSEEVAALHAEYGQRVYRFCYRLSGNRHEAEDLTQEVFVAALEGYDRFAGRAAISTWLYKIAFFRWRARKKLRYRQEIPLEDDPSYAATTEETDRIVLEIAIGTLPEPLRQAFLSTKVEGLSCGEAAKRLGIPVGTLKYRVHEAVLRLQAELAVPPTGSEEIEP